MLQFLHSKFVGIGVGTFLLLPDKLEDVHLILRESLFQGFSASVLDAAGKRVLAGEYQLEGYTAVIRLEVFNQSETDYVFLIGGMDDATEDVQDPFVHTFIFLEPRS